MAAAPTVFPLYLPFIPMAITQKIKVVLEVDLTYDEQARASHLPGTAVNETDTAYARLTSRPADRPSPLCRLY